MMTSSNGNIFWVTGPLWGESISYRLRPLTEISNPEILCFLALCLCKRQSKSGRWWFETPSRSLWSHCNEMSSTWLRLSPFFRFVERLLLYNSCVVVRSRSFANNRFLRNSHESQHIARPIERGMGCDHKLMIFILPQSEERCLQYQLYSTALLQHSTLRQKCLQGQRYWPNNVNEVVGF